MTDAPMQPHDLHAERELLGAMLTLDATFGAVQAEYALRPESFFSASHQVIFAAMLKLASDGKPISAFTVGNHLAKDGDQLERAGGRDRLALLEVPTSPHHAMHYAEVVRDKARWRSRYDAANVIREAALAEDATLYAAGQSGLADDVTHDRAMYDAERQNDLVFALMEGKAKAEFFWPFSKLNQLQAGGMRRGQLIVVSGYTNEGKSHFAAQLLDVNRKHGRVCLYDNEMDPTEQAARRVTRSKGVSYAALMDGNLGDEERSAVLEHLNGPVHWPIVDTAGWTVEEVALHIRQYRWDLVVIDILHNFAFEDERQIAASVARLKAAARMAQCVIVLVAHVNRGGVQGGLRRRPVRSDLRWSGEIENLADAVCFVYREQDAETYEPTEDGAIYFDKCRGGKLGGLAVRFNPAWLRFEIAEPDAEPIGSFSGASW